MVFLLGASLADNARQDTPSISLWLDDSSPGLSVHYSYIRKEPIVQTKTQKPLVISISIFIGLAIIFAVLLFAASGLDDSFAQTILVSLGSAIFGAGLTFFLLRLTGRE